MRKKIKKIAKQEIEYEIKISKNKPTLAMKNLKDKNPSTLNIAGIKYALIISSPSEL